MLSETEGYANIRDQIEATSQQYLKVAELEALLAKSENWNMVLSKQLQELQSQNEELQRNLDELSK